MNIVATKVKEHVGSHWDQAAPMLVEQHSAAQVKQSEGSDKAPQP